MDQSNFHCHIQNLHKKIYTKQLEKLCLDASEINMRTLMYIYYIHKDTYQQTHVYKYKFTQILERAQPLHTNTSTHTHTQRYKKSMANSKQLKVHVLSLKFKLQ